MKKTFASVAAAVVVAGIAVTGATMLSNGTFEKALGGNYETKLGSKIVKALTPN